MKGQKVMRPVPLSDTETKALIDYMMNDLRK
jgi:cytochrome c5